MKTIRVLGPRVLVKPFKLEEVDDIYKKVKNAGLAIPDTNERRREEAAIDEGVVVSVSALAWSDWKDPTPWCKEGDRVMWARHAGKVVDYDERSGDRLIILNDEDVICRVDGENND